MRLSRRTLLKGIGGAAVGLPVLECMLDRNGVAYAAGGAPPKRYAIVFAGQALGGDGWAEDQNMVAGRRYTEAGHFIVPPEVGRNFTITTPLKPLTALQGDFSIVSGLSIPYSSTSMDPADVPAGGAYRDFHGGGASPLLSGTRSLTASFTAHGITSDQVIADLNRGMTTQDSLVYRAQPSWYLSGSSYAGRQYISYRGDGDRIEATESPQIAYQSLFGQFTPSGAADAAKADFRRRSRLSVLDLIANKRDKLLAKVGSTDRARLQRHFDEIRDLENRIRALPPPMTSTCQKPLDPGADPGIGGDNAGSSSDMIGMDTGYSNEDQRARVFADLIHMAFVCDLSRVATLQLTVFQSHMNVYPISSTLGLPIKADLHEVGHNGDANNRGQIVVSTLLGWHISHYAYLIDKLRSTPEGAGNVLDNSAVVFMPEAGHGTQLNDAMSPYATHSVENMILLVAGRAGGLNPGQHIAKPGAHPAQVLISAMNAAGYMGDTLGEVTGGVSELFM
jgi:uncharacterized protein DUF1552